MAGSRVYIDTHRGFRRRHAMILGQFLEHFHRQVYGGVFEPGAAASDAAGFRGDVIEALRALRVPIVRWPGGCFASAYHWLDGVGRAREPSYDKAWRVEDPNTFGTDEFVSWCRLVGAEPYICTNAGTGTAEEMSNWVEYCNLTVGRWARLRAANGFPEPHRVRYWSIGNENYGTWEMGAKTAEEWAHLVAESAKMMKRVDPSIKLLAAALPDADWTLKLLRSAGQYLDYVSIHGYWDPLWQRDEPSTYDQCMARFGEPEKAIAATEGILALAGFEGKIGIAFDEWNLRGWHHPNGNSAEAIRARDRNDLNATYTMADAVFSAGFLNTCIRHGDSVLMANMAPAVNTRGPLFVHPKGIVKRTTYHVLSMYADLVEPNVAHATIASERPGSAEAAFPVLDAIATCDDEGKEWSLVLVNPSRSEPVACRVAVDGRELEGRCTVTALEGDSSDAYNDIDRPERVVPIEREIDFQGLTLSPHSVTALRARL